MRENFAHSLARVLKHEGGYVNRPDDPGGMTNLGVTRTTWARWKGRAVSEQEMRDLTPEKVEPLYRERFWDAVSGDDLPSGLDHATFDFAVNSGPGRAARTLQLLVGAAPDGQIGPKTLRLLADEDAAVVARELCDARLRWLQNLPTFRTFGRGWTARVNAVRDEAVEMAG